VNADIVRTIAVAMLVGGAILVVVGLAARWWDAGAAPADRALILYCYVLLFSVAVVFGGLGMLALMVGC
jgi:hypothetical protein